MVLNATFNKNSIISWRLGEVYANILVKLSAREPEYEVHGMWMLRMNKQNLYSVDRIDIKRYEARHVWYWAFTDIRACSTVNRVTCRAVRQKRHIQPFLTYSILISMFLY